MSHLRLLHASPLTADDNGPRRVVCRVRRRHNKTPKDESRDRQRRGDEPGTWGIGTT
jgi:hypothetical protein